MMGLRSISAIWGWSWASWADSQDEVFEAGDVDGR